MPDTLTVIHEPSLPEGYALLGFEVDGHGCTMMGPLVILAETDFWDFRFHLSLATDLWAYFDAATGTIAAPSQTN